ncbi:MAG: helix-turn-helix domain-containing protein [Xanthomonadales bacterium]|nr:helix-turn-helix domain-containing protein [Xanthomonadales bacterium]
MQRQTVMTLDQAAELLGVSVADIEAEITAGRLAAMTIGRHRRILGRDLDLFLRAQGSRGLPKALPWRAAIFASALFAGLAWAAIDFPFPQWAHLEIGPREALYVDEADAGNVDPDQFLPVNAPLDFRRHNNAPNPGDVGYTHSLMSLQQHNDVPPETTSFPWTFFLNLDTNHDRGDAVGSIVNLHKRGAGWAAAYHADVFAHGPGAAIGSSIETYDMGDERSYLVGLNVQNKAHQGAAALQVQTGPLPENHPWWAPGMDGSWMAGLRLAGMPGAGHYRTGIEFDRHTHGRRGLWMRGQFDIGLDLGQNSIRMAGGVPLELDGQAGVALRHNPGNNRIEFLHEGEVIAWLATSRRDVNLAD